MLGVVQASELGFQWTGACWYGKRQGHMGGGKGFKAVSVCRFDMQQKWANPLMGWTSGKDTLGCQVFGHLNFDSP